jgi:hypothetical protein
MTKKVVTSDELERCSSPSQLFWRTKSLKRALGQFLIGPPFLIP